MMRDYFELTKPRIVLLVLITATIGYYLGGQGIHSYVRLFYLLLGTSLVCGGSAVLNHYLERDTDNLMNRTRKRPLPAGRIEPRRALQFGILISLLGIFVLYTKLNILTAFLGLLTNFMYVLVYTPMKKVSWWNTTIGAFPGAMPPLGGWAAATGHLNFDAGILFLILFIWQHPHFYAIAWMFREDYRNAGFKMLPGREHDGWDLFHQIQCYSILLIPVSLIPAVTGLSGFIYLLGAFVTGLWMLCVSLQFIRSESLLDARRLLKATVIYLPILLTLIIVDARF
ncbi:MAG: heme o synthase [Candidatus Omnitrophica bacterium]|nr:heme o synthase [Candidatus Omnitrophota bacterium]